MILIPSVHTKYSLYWNLSDTFSHTVYFVQSEPQCQNFCSFVFGLVNQALYKIRDKKSCLKNNFILADQTLFNHDGFFPELVFICTS